jgi:hypothetical protein
MLKLAIFIGGSKEDQFERATHMAYDETTAERVRELLSSRPDVAERKMTGGLCFMVRDTCAVRSADEAASWFGWEPMPRMQRCASRTFNRSKWLDAP